MLKYKISYIDNDTGINDYFIVHALSKRKAKIFFQKCNSTYFLNYTILSVKCLGA